MSKNTGNWNSGNCNSGNRNSGNRNSGNYNSGNWNSGDGNSGNYNSGLFNTDEPYMRCFNKETTLKREDIDMPHFYGFKLNCWIDELNMTKEEKKEHPEYKAIGGFLKTVDYKTAWRVFWEETDEENRQKFLNLPNFDPAIFEEITGIDVHVPENTVKEETINIDGKDYTMSEIKKALNK